jgi:uncharacterized protein YybS (DUF2232 family)
MSRLDLFRSFALALASSLLLFLSGMALPIAGFLLIALAPQPVLGFGIKNGKGRALGLLALAVVLLILFGGEELQWGYSLVALLVVLLFFSLGRGWPVEYVVATASGGMFIVVSGMLLYTFGSVSSLWRELETMLRENIELSLKAYERLAFPAEVIALLREQVPRITEMIVRIMPALVFAGFAIVTLLNLVMLYRRFPDQRSMIVSAGDLREWKAPEPLVWCFILSGLSLFLPAGWEAWKISALNLFLVSVIFYFFQGLAIVAYYFHHKNVPHFLRSLAYVLIFFEQVFTVFVVALGLFDLWGDFRRLKKKDLNPGGAS